MANDFDIMQQYRESKMALMQDRIQKLEFKVKDLEATIKEIRAWAKQTNKIMKVLKK